MATGKPTGKTVLSGTFWTSRRHSDGLSLSVGRFVTPGIVKRTVGRVCTHLRAYSGRKEWSLRKNKILGVVDGSKRIHFLFILQKRNQVNEMVSYTFVHPTAATRCSHINSIGKCTAFFFC